MTSRRRSPSALWTVHLPALVWCVIVSWLLLAPPSPSLSRLWVPPYSDKLVHCAVFAVTALLVARSLRAAAPALGSRFGVALVAAAAAMLLGTLLEGLQPFTGRTAEAGDLLANTLGALAGAAVWAVWGLWRSRPARVGA